MCSNLRAFCGILSVAIIQRGTPRVSETDTPDIPPTEPTPEGIDPERLRKLHELRAEGRDPFAVERFPVTHHAADILAQL